MATVRFTTLILACFAWIPATALAQEFKNSVASTDFDFITQADPSAFVELRAMGRGLREMPDKRPDSGPLHRNAFLFEASFSDGTRVELHLDPAFANDEAALVEAQRYTGPLGRLPTALRRGVERVVVHQGGLDTTATSDIGLIVLFSDNASKRISNHDLEETVFHESVHATWDPIHAGSTEWLRAQREDGGFLTEYAKSRPTREDLAESALFAYTLIHHPERFPADVAQRIRATIPHRIEFVAKLLPPDEPIFFPATTARVNSASEPSIEAEPAVGEDASRGCAIQLPGVFADILSNALREFEVDAAVARDLHVGAQDRFASSEALFQAAVSRTGIAPDALKRAIVQNLHVNCVHPAADDSRELASIAAWQPSPSPEPAAAASNLLAGTVVQDGALQGLVPYLRWIVVLLALMLTAMVIMTAVLVRRGPRGA